MVLAHHDKAMTIVHHARIVYERQLDDGAWLSMEKFYASAIAAALQDAFDLGFRAAGGMITAAQQASPNGDDNAIS